MRRKKPPAPSLSPSTRLGLVLGVGLLPLAALTAALVGVYLRREEGRLDLLTAQKTAPVTVHTVVRRIERGEVLTEDLLASLRLPPAFATPCALTDLAVAGRTAVEPLLPGECLRPERLGPRDAQGMQVLVSPGQRAESVNLPSDASVSGFLVPGDRIDVVVTLPAEGEHPAETQTLVQGATVLHVGTAALPSERGGEPTIQPQVTLALFPTDAERVTATLEHGRPRLTLRSAIDFTHAEGGAPVRTADLLGAPRDRLTVTEYRERVDPAGYARMVRIFQGPEEVVERVVDPHLLRPLGPTPSTSTEPLQRGRAPAEGT